MAPIEPDLTNSNLIPFLYLGIEVIATPILVAFIARNVIYKSYKSLPPSQDTRWRQSNRQKHFRIILALTCVSFIQAVYHLVQIPILSYKVWAHEMGQPLPTRPYTLDSINELALGRWLNQVSPITESWEIVAESSARYWWAQQLFFGSAAWALYVGIEGRRRNIKHLWAFILLSFLVSRAFAINLFFLAILSTPVPQPPRYKSDQLQLTSSTDSNLFMRYTPVRLHPLLQRVWPYLPHNPFNPPPSTWRPFPWMTNLQLTGTIISTFLIPYSTSTPLFNSLFIVNCAILVRLAYMPNLTSPGFGSTSFTPTELTNNTILVSRFLAISSFILFWKQTIVALLDTDPGAHRHRHSAYLAALHLPHEDERGHLVRSASAVSRLLSTIHEHPATARVGYDVLLCAVSIITWAVIRGIDEQKILASIGLASTPPPRPSTATESKPRRRKRTSSSNNDVAANTSATEDTVAPSTARKSKSKSSSSKSESSTNDPTYQPTSPSTDLVRWQGEEESKENGEAGAIAAVGFVLGGLGVLATGVLGAEEF